MVINVGGVVLSRAATPGAALAAKDGSGHVDGRQFGDMLEKLANASVGPSSDRPAAKADSAKPVSGAAAPEVVSVAAGPETVSALVTDLAALAAGVPVDAGPATGVPVTAVGQGKSQADKPGSVTDPQPADSIPTLAMLLGISTAVPLQDAAPANPPAGTGDAESSAAVDGGVPAGGTATPVVGANAGFGRMAHALARAVASTGAAAPAASPDPAAVATAVSVPAALGTTPPGDPSTIASVVTATPSTAAAVATAANPVPGVGVPAKPDVLGATQTKARASVAQPGSAVAQPGPASAQPAPTSAQPGSASAQPGPTSIQPAVVSQDAPAVATGPGPQMAGAGAPPVLSASVHAAPSASAAGTGKAVPGPQTASAAIQAPPVGVDATTAAVLGGTTPAPALGGSGDAKPDGRPRGSLAGDAGGAPAAKAAVASGIFDPQMRLAADLPAVDHVVGARQAAASTATQASGGATLDAEVPHQIVQAIRLQWTQGVGTARVTLQPDYLGDLRIDIRVDRGAVTAVLDASNPAVRQWIEGHESTLRQGLAEQGLTLDRLVVKDEHTAPDAGAEQRRQPRDEQPPEPRRRPAAAPTDATFEVVM